MDYLLHLHKRWVQRTLAFILGALGALAFAPLYIFPALLLSFSAIWFLLETEIEEGSSAFRIFILGWWFGLGHFTAGLYWIAHALFVDLGAFWWLIPFTLLGIPSLLAIFTGVAFVLIKLWPFPGLSRAFAFAGIWLGLEWLRGHLFTGFPWNLLGYSWAFSSEILQVASLGGVYGLSLLAILMALCLGSLISKNFFERSVAISIYLLVILAWFWGQNRLKTSEVIDTPSLAIRLVQPNIPQTLKWSVAQKESNFKQLLTMTTLPSALPLKAVIWPETAIPFFLEQDKFRRLLIAEALPKDALLFTGALRRTGPKEIRNSIIVLDKESQILSFCDKFHLVPFGEYIPFRETLDDLFGQGSIKKITVGAIDFKAGAGPESISLPTDFPTFSGLVCYEVIFPSAVINPSQKRPLWMLNVTNDAWYGKTSGPYQHFEMARMRAIEEGIPLVRAANSGISGVFDAYGRVMGSIPLGTRGVLDILLPPPTQKVTFYGRWGDWITFGLIGIIFALAGLFALKRSNVR
ncbi:MAG: hypothetical protein ACD_16C00056G0003 [uncultured bacterium]|nr:MAG: hypothetical protein ACD_16C00056G0003 [uncultured bacterium]OFW69455.1 MAG: apolipoprotein N-acyltransferase [Alphaproteobacteria bacterium GWC2_42_16]OFW74172.1 MAG: apolipoprotein N-acyltransferase [Alphaproteobacteria bacterium GWA2_41_27]OFW84356.1 MAG: apolipoprotein N-acyltransferase [Alphaproteobacteria bacterium RIFCSPHIGHO2_12_FULL_42_100]OFW84734.1 MAG: apolipoprotein N-acyltransferase [Alphaproteobacteria bacterium RBG_16_42_14]OFW90916.1 MAG: apolipoprotein N-acyltransfera